MKHSKHFLCLSTVFLLLTSSVLSASNLTTEEPQEPSRDNSGFSVLSSVSSIRTPTIEEGLWEALQAIWDDQEEDFIPEILDTQSLPNSSQGIGTPDSVQDDCGLSTTSI